MKRLIDTTEEELISSKPDKATYERPLSTWRAAYNVATVVVGAGVLNLPAATRDSGWIGIGLLTLLGLVASYTGVLIGRCMYISGQIEERYPDRPTYGDIGYAAWGHFGRLFCSIQVHLTLVGVATIFVVLGAGFVVDLHLILTGNEMNHTYAALVFGVVVWLHVWIPDLQFLGKLSFLSILVTIYMAIVVIIEIVIHDNSDLCEYNSCSTKVVHTGYEFALGFVAFAFSYGAHPVLPTIQARMRTNHRHYERTVVITFGLITVSYLPLVIFAYNEYGEKTESPILNNLQAGFSKTSAIFALLLNIILSYPVVLKPPQALVENYLKIRPDMNLVSVLQRAVVRSIFVCVTVIVAISIPSFPLVLDLVAAVTNTFTGFILPAAFYLTLFWPKTSYLTRILNIFIIVIGLTAFGVGTFVSMEHIIKL